MKKRILAILLLICMLSLCLVSCSKKDKDSEDDSAAETGNPVTVYYAEEDNFSIVVGIDSGNGPSDSLKELIENGFEGLTVKSTTIYADKNLVLPATIENACVMAVMGQVFSQCDAFDSVTVAGHIEIEQFNSFTGCKDELLIIGAPNSEAEAFAEKYEIKFKATNIVVSGNINATAPSNGSRVNEIYFEIYDHIAWGIAFKNDECESEFYADIDEWVEDDEKLISLKVIGDDFVMPVTVDDCILIGTDSASFGDATTIKSITVAPWFEFEGQALEGCSDNLVIRSTKGSLAEEYARKNGIDFEAIEMTITSTVTAK